MKLTPTELGRLVSNARNLQFDGRTVESLRSVASSIEMSSRFVESLLASHSISENVDATAVCASMDTLEKTAENYELFVCIFMAHLWPHSNALQLHDICDSIDLWLTNCRSPDLSQHLLMLANSQSDDGVRLHFEQLAKLQ